MVAPELRLSMILPRRTRTELCPSVKEAIPPGCDAPRLVDRRRDGAVRDCMCAGQECPVRPLRGMLLRHPAIARPGEPRKASIARAEGQQTCAMANLRRRQMLGCA